MKNAFLLQLCTGLIYLSVPIYLHICTDAHVQIPQISYASTSLELSDKSRYCKKYLKWKRRTSLKYFCIADKLKILEMEKADFLEILLSKSFSFPLPNFTFQIGVVHSEPPFPLFGLFFYTLVLSQQTFPIIWSFLFTLVLSQQIH